MKRIAVLILKELGYWSAGAFAIFVWAFFNDWPWGFYTMAGTIAAIRIFTLTREGIRYAKYRRVA